MSIETTKSNDGSKEINVESTERVDLKGYEGIYINATEFALDERILEQGTSDANGSSSDSTGKKEPVIKAGVYNSIAFKNYIKEIFQGMVVKLKGKDKDKNKSEEELQAEEPTTEK